MNIESTPVAPKDYDSVAKTIGSLGIAQTLAPPSANSEAISAKQYLDKATQEKINAQNTKRLKKRFGESFVEGRDGYNARSLAFFDQPDFAEQLKTIIPNKYEALQTLRDNFDYINTQLAEHYKEDRAEKETP